jgi:hypothetical protein
MPIQHKPIPSSSPTEGEKPFIAVHAYGTCLSLAFSLARAEPRPEAPITSFNPFNAGSSCVSIARRKSYLFFHGVSNSSSKTLETCEPASHVASVSNALVLLSIPCLSFLLLVSTVSMPWQEHRVDIVADATRNARFSRSMFCCPAQQIINR